MALGWEAADMTLPRPDFCPGQGYHDVPKLAGDLEGGVAAGVEGRWHESDTSAP